MICILEEDSTGTGHCLPSWTDHDGLIDPSSRIPTTPLPLGSLVLGVKRTNPMMRIWVDLGSMECLNIGCVKVWFADVCGHVTDARCPESGCVLGQTAGEALRGKLSMLVCNNGCVWFDQAMHTPLCLLQRTSSNPTGNRTGFPGALERMEMVPPPHSIPNATPTLGMLPQHQEWYQECWCLGAFPNTCFCYDQVPAPERPAE